MFIAHLSSVLFAGIVAIRLTNKIVNLSHVVM